MPSDKIRLAVERLMAKWTSPDYCEPAAAGIKDICDLIDQAVENARKDWRIEFTRIQ